jgi:integrase
MKVRETETNKQTNRRRCWADQHEQQALINAWDKHPERKYALRLMFEGGLRSKEVPRITTDDFERSTTNDGQTIWRVRVLDSKSGSRTTVVPESVADLGFTLKNTLGISNNTPITNKTSRTIQNWVKWAAEDAGGYNDAQDRVDPSAWTQPDYRYFSAHDCRRTWATHLVHSGVPESVVMDWGGWEDYSTFSDHYYGEETAERTAQYLERAGMS